MNQRNWNRNVIFLTVITQIKSIAAVDDILPAIYFRTPKCTYLQKDGYYTASCGYYIENEDKDQDHYLPPNLPHNIQALDLRPNDKTEYVRFDLYSEDLHIYPQLKSIYIQRMRSSTHKSSTYYEAYSSCFKNLEVIQYIEFTHSNLSEDFKITWPKNLQVLNLTKNNFHYLEIKECRSLQELIVNENFLQDVPKFYHQNMPLKILRLKGNPLDNMTILSIAPFCELTMLELKFPPGARYDRKDSTTGYCDCMMLKKWSHEMGISGPEKLTCHQPKSQNEECPDTLFEKAKTLHKSCPILKSVNSYPILLILEYVLLFVVALILIMALALYIIRHYHLKDKFAAFRSHSNVSESDALSRSDETEEEEKTSDYE